MNEITKMPEAHKLEWRKVPDSLPPDPEGGWFSPNVWLAFSDGRVMMGQCLHADAGAKYDSLVHDWFAIDPEDGQRKSLGCFGGGLRVIAWMPLALPDHPFTLGLFLEEAIKNGGAITIFGPDAAVTEIEFQCVISDDTDGDGYA